MLIQFKKKKKEDTNSKIRLRIWHGSGRDGKNITGKDGECSKKKKRESCPAADKSKICNDSLAHLNYIPQSFNLKIRKVHS